MPSKFIHRAYTLFVASANYLRSPLLLGIRVYFFWQLFQTGMGKLGNIAKVTQFFSSLGIPFPGLNAWFVGSLVFWRRPADCRPFFASRLSYGLHLDDGRICDCRYGGIFQLRQ